VQEDTLCLKQLMDEYENTLSSFILVQTVDNTETHTYAIIDISKQEG